MLAKVDPKQSLSVAGLGSGLSKSPLADDKKTREILENIKTFSGGITVAEDIKGEAVFVAKTEDAAKDLMKTLKDRLEQVKGVASLLAGEKKDQPGAPLADVLETVKISAEGTTVTMRGQATAEILEKALNPKKKEQ